MASPPRLRASAMDPDPNATKAIISTMKIVPLFLGFN
jgi:hypothetical protein